MDNFSSAALEEMKVDNIVLRINKCHAFLNLSVNGRSFRNNEDRKNLRGI
jgi:hypothetical protein